MYFRNEMAVVDQGRSCASRDRLALNFSQSLLALISHSLGIAGLVCACIQGVGEPVLVM